MERFRNLSGPELLRWFDQSRQRLGNVFRGLDPSARVPWFGPPMSVASSVTARIMETWAHGQDIADALGVEPGAQSATAAHRPYRSPGAAIQLPGERSRSADRADPGRVDLVERRTVDLGPGGCRQPGQRSGARLLPARHPAPASRRYSGRSDRRGRAIPGSTLRRRSRVRRGLAGNPVSMSGLSRFLLVGRGREASGRDGTKVQVAKYDSFDLRSDRSVYLARCSKDILRTMISRSGRGSMLRSDAGAERCDDRVGDCRLSSDRQATAILTEACGATRLVGGDHKTPSAIGKPRSPSGCLSSLRLLSGMTFSPAGYDAKPAGIPLFSLTNSAARDGMR